jgi:hypothetical protein
MATEPNKVIYSMVGVSKYYDKRASAELTLNQEHQATSRT